MPQSLPQDRAAGETFFDSQAAEIVHNYGRGRAIVAVDGFAALAFSHKLAAALVRSGHSSVVASIDDFVRAPQDRPVGTLSAGDAYYANRYDYATFRRILIDPFRLGGSASFVLASFDEGASRPAPAVWRSKPADAILVVAGPFLARPELRGVFNYTIFLDTPVRSSDATLDIALDHYSVDAEPRFSATAIVDTTDPDLPRRVFADSC